MAKILWLNWSGGGNLPPSLGVARALQERGHTIAFAGRPEMVPRVKTAGFRAIELTRAYEQVDRYPQGTFLTRMSCYLTSPAVEEEVQSVAAAEAPDVAVIDAMFPAALAQAVEFNAPTAVFVHTFVFRQLDMWRGMFARLDGKRREAGFAGLPGLDALWGARPHRLDQPRRIRRRRASRLGEGAPRRPGARRRAIRGRDAAALAGERRDAARPRQLLDRLRAAQCRQGA
ncbi:MAG TPA: hypothetical protein VKA12_02660, partial [Roseiarcus sp.]|nr:hypothetical protein [Roseiarcus sp.]